MTKYRVTDLQACEPESLTFAMDIRVTREGIDSMGFDRVTVEGPSREAVENYVRDNWGDDNETGGWFSEYVVARIEEIDA
jgi:hypothetical protein